MANPSILKKFPTEKYKRFYYPTRPLFTLLTGFFFVALGLIGLLPTSWALYLSAAFAFDDLPLTPIMSIVTAINNLTLGRKKSKAIITLIVISLATIAGGLLGFFVLSHSAVFMSLMSKFIADTSCSPLLISIAAIGGGLIAHLTDKITPMTGSMLGILLVSLVTYLFPISVPLLVDTVFTCAAGLAFVASVTVKQALRAYYKIRYGHTNADGYSMNKTAEDQNEFIENQAKKFDVTPEAFTQLTKHCKLKIAGIKQNASIYEEFSNQRQPFTNSYKDIYHGLMDPEVDVQLVKELIVQSSRKEIQKSLQYENEESIANIRFLTRAGELRSDPEVRMKYHQIYASPGLEEEYTISFERKFAM